MVVRSVFWEGKGWAKKVEVGEGGEGRLTVVEVGYVGVKENT